MKKSEIIDALCENHLYDKSDLKGKTKDELKALLFEISDTSNLFPNGRDVDAENWDD